MEIYKNIYLFLLVIGFFVAVAVNKYRIYNLRKLNKFTVFFILVLTLLMGTLPVIFTGGDRQLYHDYFVKIQTFGFGNQVQDKLFGVYMAVTSLFLNVEMWFILTSFIYVFNFFYFSKKATSNYFILFLALITNFVFFAYGTNTIRAGFAASFLLLALANRNKSYLFFTFLISAIGLHVSMVLPVVAILISKKFNWSKFYIVVWVLSIPISFLIGGVIHSYFGLLFEEDRLKGYLTNQKTHYKIGFRIDFIIYSMLPVVAGYYYIFKKNYRDELYFVLFNSYLICNAFWILVIKANFSDRFAYLSWYIYMAVLIYPLLNAKVVKNQSLVLSLMLIGNILFTFYMFS